MSQLSLTPLETQNIKTYAQTRSYAPAVVKGGLPYLVQRWQNAVERWLEDEEFTFEQYLSLLDCRRIIDEFKLLIKQLSYQQLENILTPIDESFNSKTERVYFCVLGPTAERDLGYEPSAKWYYYRLPIHKKQEWQTYCQVSKYD
jgi:hypothetical protein